VRAEEFAPVPQAEPPREEDRMTEAPAPEPSPNMPAPEGRDEELQRLAAERDEYLAAAQQARSDLENYRRRTRDNEARVGEERLAGFLRGFLDAFDDLDRVIRGGTDEGGAQNVIEGARLARENLWKQMEAAGVAPIPAQGTDFDPNVHEALATVPAEGAAPGSVVEVIKPGYRLGGRVLRPAQVVVADPQR
jgi:molecular chaperone GrpE